MNKISFLVLLLQMYLTRLSRASFEESNQNDPYVETLTSQGIQVVSIATLKFQFKNLITLLSCLQNADKYSGLLLSSPRCAEAVCECCKNGDFPNIFDKWKNLKCFVVGEATSRVVEDKLGLKYEGSTIGNMIGLLQNVNAYHFEKPLLMPCGNLHKASPEEQDILIDKVEVYETIEHPELGSNVLNFLKTCKSQLIVIFFSPSGVKFSLPYILEPKRSGIQFIAIGPTTSKEMENHSLPVHAVCEKPNPESLLLAILKVIKISKSTLPHF